MIELARMLLIGLLAYGCPMGSILAQETPEPAASSAGNPVDQLTGTHWNLTVRSVGVEPVDTRQDIIRFEDRHMRSDALTSEGYPGSNCTIRQQADGSVTWETMQTKAGEGVVFWRGELRDGQMTGVLTKQPEAGPPRHFSFTASATTAEAALPEPEQPAPAVQPPGGIPQAPAEPADRSAGAQPPPQKKKWWFW